MADPKISIPTLEYFARTDAQIMDLQDYTAFVYPLECHQLLVRSGVSLRGGLTGEAVFFSDLTFEEQLTGNFRRLSGVTEMMLALNTEFESNLRFKVRILTEEFPKSTNVASAVYAQIGSLERYPNQQVNQRLLEKVDAAASVLGLPLWAQTTYNPVEFAIDLRKIIDKHR